MPAGPKKPHREMLRVAGWPTSGTEEHPDDLKVYCPGKTDFVTLRDCGDCEGIHGVLVEPEGRRSFVVCEPEHEHTDAHGEWLGPPVGKLMQRHVVSVHADASAISVLWVLLDHNISGVPVVNDAGVPVGIVSKTDLLSKIYRDQVAEDEDDDRLSGPIGLDRVTVDHVMTPFVFTLPEDAPAARAAALMVQEGVHRIPVLGADGAMVGLISSLDILQWFGEAAGTLQKAE